MFRLWYDRLLASPCLLYYFCCNVQWSCYIYAYVFIPVTACTCVRTGSPPQLRCCSLLCRRRPGFPAVLTWFHLFATVWREITTAAVFKLGARFLDTFQARRGWIKIDSAVTLGETPSSEFVQYVLRGDTTDEDRWVDLLCCSPHCDTAESCLTNDTLTSFSSSSDCYDDWRRPSPTACCPSYDASSPFHQSRLLRSCSDASAAQRLLLAASYIVLVTFLVLYCYRLSFSLLYFLVFP